MGRWRFKAARGVSDGSIYVTQASGCTMTPLAVGKYIYGLSWLLHHPSSRRRFIAVLAAYLDESGDRDTKVLPVGGYVATGEQWRKFSREWLDILKPNAIEVFHMVDLENGLHDFEGWPREKRDKLFRKLAQTINSRVIFQTWMGVDLKECEDILKKYNDKVFATPYAFCGVGCISLISNWARQHWKQESVVVFFEEGRKFSGEIFKLWDRVSRRDWLREKYRITSVQKGPKKELIPLQAADAFAYEVNVRRRNLSLPDRQYLKWLAYPKSRGKFEAGANLRDFVRSVNEDFSKYLGEAEEKERKRRETKQ